MDSLAHSHKLRWSLPAGARSLLLPALGVLGWVCWAGFSRADVVLAAPNSGAVVTAAATTQPAGPAVSAKDRSEQQTLDFLKANEPDVYQSAMVLKDKDAKKFDALMHDMGADVKKLLEMDKRNHAMFLQAVEDRRLGYQALQLAKDVRNEGLAAELRKSKTEELKAVLAAQFDARRKLRFMEIEELAARITKLQDQLGNMKHQIEDRDQRKDELVGERLKALLSTNPKVEW